MQTTILIGTGRRAELAARVADLGADRRVVALIDEPVARAHPEFVPADWLRIVLPGGEATKSFATLEQVLRRMAQWAMDRRSVLVAIGGGAVGDLGGLAASLYLRGIDLVQVPTTLLAMLDSSVGGKTAIDLPEGKNLVGTFHPARFMLADPELCASLEPDHIRAGLAEAIKMAIGFSRELFELLETSHAMIRQGEPIALTRVIELAVAAKVDTVRADPLESNGRRRCLNLGHTLAHALEAISGYTLLHGLAVGRGLRFALDVATARGTLAPEVAERCRRLLELYGFPATPLPPSDRLLTFFARDKKMEAGRLHMVLPTGLGTCATFPVRPEELTGS